MRKYLLGPLGMRTLDPSWVFLFHMKELQCTLVRWSPFCASWMQHCFVHLRRDWWYNGYYINSDDSDDGRKARGFNYHNGPVRVKCPQWKFTKSFPPVRTTNYRPSLCACYRNGSGLLGSSSERSCTMRSVWRLCSPGCYKTRCASSEAHCATTIRTFTRTTGGHFPN